MARVVITDRIPDEGIELLSADHDVVIGTPGQDLTELVRGADAVLTMLADQVDDALLDAAGDHLRIVANVAVGYNNVDVAACDRRGVVVTNTPKVLTDATADLAFALLLMVTRRCGEGERLIRAGQPWAWGMNFMVGAGLQSRTLGIIGAGQIGRAVGRRAKAFGMNIVYSGRRSLPSDTTESLGARRLDVPELLATADVVTLHCPYVPADRPDSTHHLIGAAELASMKPTAYLINTARGAIVDEDALVRALADGTIAGAGLDVFEHEPRVHPGLLALENVVLLPHLGSATVETRTAMAVLAAQNVLAVLAGREPVTPVPVPTN
ncbi:MAG: D-glycerate dehydrogenase [Austwickia sp.]|nr:D-glycerate dehydrogenase [Austwickia sp.]MBK8436550.1 D-glycerate dehydrogenase [Austwickia sp.]MBK9102228.1 D-glycerate dehydrogenase [Austwickia sp.]